MPTNTAQAARADETGRDQTTGTPGDRVQVLIRVPRPVYDTIKAKATAERRSVNAQVLVLLEQYLSARGLSGNVPEALTVPAPLPGCEHYC